MKSIYLLPGKIAAAAEPTMITTILGSCVAVALFDREKGVAGLNHYLLPEAPGGEVPNPRYGSFALPKLVEALEQLGARKHRMAAKVYGGGNVLGDVTIGIGIGQRNIQYALSFLENQGIPVLERNLAGEVGRKIIFNTSDFSVDHRFMREQEDATDTSGFQRPRAVTAVKVLVVDDSATVRSLFQKIFAKAGLTVVGVAADAYEARELIVKLKPDVVTLDIEMPKMNGVAFLEKVMTHAPLPIVMVSSLDSQGDAALRALELGAIEFVHKPSQFDPDALRTLGEMLVEKVRAAASSTGLKKRPPKPIAEIRTTASATFSPRADLRLIAMGGNAGSQDSIEAILSTLPSDTPPVLISNGTLAGLLESFFQKVRRSTKAELHVARNGEVLRWGCVYFAPPLHHLEVERDGVGYKAKVTKGTPVCGQVPSAEVLLQSAAHAAGPHALGLLLGGYGNDGVEGLGKLQSLGAVTMTENPASARFPFIPQNAVTHGYADHVLAPSDLASMIWKVRNKAA